MKVIDVEFKKLHYTCLCCGTDIFIRVPDGKKWEECCLYLQPICDECQVQKPERDSRFFTPFDPRNCWGFVDYEQFEKREDANAFRRWGKKK